MSLRKYTKFVVYTLTILLAALISEWVVLLINGYETPITYQYVALRMLILVLIYIPLITILEGYIKKASQKFATQSKKIAKSSYLGLTLGFALALFILFALFSIVLINQNPFLDIKNWFSNLF